MNGIVINIDPVIFRVGLLEVRWYSLAIVLGIAAAIWLTTRLAPRKGIDREHIYTLALWAIVGGVVGARLFHVIDYWEHYIHNPQEILGFQGLAIWGALAGGGLAVALYAWVTRLPLGRLLDVLVPGLLLAQIIGRFGCIVNGDAYGGATSLPWAFIYSHPGSSIPPSLFAVPTHPYPVYEMLWNAMALAVIWRLGRHFRKDGLVFLSYLAFYSLGRFLLTFVRQENGFFGGLQEAQIVALLVLAAVAVIMAYLAVQRRFYKRITSAEGG